MEEYRLIRDGARSLKFRGAVLGEASSHDHSGPNQNRWTEVAIYRTICGNYVVKILGRTRWQGESDRHSVTVCDSPAKVLAALTDEDGEMSNVAVIALEKAAEVDTALATIESERVE